MAETGEVRCATRESLVRVAQCSAVAYLAGGLGGAQLLLDGGQRGLERSQHEHELITALSDAHHLLRFARKPLLNALHSPQLVVRFR